ncbi:MAG: helix-turn-helix transcriptional regulator [Ruminococcaceae bacterium]|nr:helix-turn-helix transcriptional regulator [Oscillospiraceae bacterium]
MNFDTIITVEFLSKSKSNMAFTNIDKLKHIKVLPYISIVQAVDGYYEIGLGGNKLENTGTGGFFIAPAGVQQEIVHHINHATGQMACRWVFLDVVINGVYRPDFLYDFPTIVPKERCNELNSLFDELFSTDDIFDNYSSYYRIMKFLLSLASHSKRSENESIHKTLEYIEKNYKSDIRINDLANNIHMSVSNFHSVFKKNFGVSPIVYINRYRLSLAAKQLTETSLSISEIATMVGYDDTQYFCKMFRKTYCLSPTQYRRITKKQAGL